MVVMNRGTKAAAVARRQDYGTENSQRGKEDVSWRTVVSVFRVTIYLNVHTKGQKQGNFNKERHFACGKKTRNISASSLSVYKKVQKAF